MNHYRMIRGEWVILKGVRPTQKHRLAIAPGILGTVYGINEEGEARYFDYDLEGAYDFAGVSGARDPRLSTPPSRAMYVRSGATECNPRPGTKCIWVRKEEER
jgi:hypothetical protein